ncbi:MAG: hypothetical protein ABIA04_00490 [Pseudomonadota bacterium]
MYGGIADIKTITSVYGFFLYVGNSRGGFEYRNSEFGDLFEIFFENNSEDELIGLDIEEAVHFSLWESNESTECKFVAFKR